MIRQGWHFSQQGCILPPLDSQEGQLDFAIPATPH